ncbi:SEL1-like repeat protein [Microvirga pudoricolor]|uniref:SEL1-like repeat protein n=1 Tax=Microvirga pudoricolor TaxID=2778729 RepID=UPI00194DD971|nr:SEL1-like repeat protein [Microvirga pudoricolor]MBM6595408.1 SEL1-like repeat protein [Microvirga pudoricolor]
MDYEDYAAAAALAHPRDRDEDAVRYFQELQFLAEDCEDQDAMLEVARCYEQGYGVQRDPAAAQRWTQRARQAQDY